MYDSLVVKTFLDKQNQLFDENVAEDEAEALEFLEDVCAVVLKNEKEVIEYLADAMDTTAMTKEEILSSDEVFKISDGRFLIVEG